MPTRNSKRLGQKQNVDEQLSTQKDKFKLKFIDTYIGYGVFANSELNPGELLLEYNGDLAIVSTKKDVESNGFTFYFKHCDKQYSIDASGTECLAKMVNDEMPSNTNCKMKKIVIDQVPRLLLYATKYIKCGEELRYDYGVGDLPWRRRHEKDVKPVLYRKPELSSEDESECDDDVQDEMEDPFHDETVDPVQDEIVDPVQDETVDPVQDETVDPVQDETVDAVQDETVDPVQDETVDPVQDETVDPVQEETADPVHDETDDAVQDETVDPVQDETVDAVQDETVDPVHDETVDPVQDETVDPVQDETVDPVQDETVDPVQDETVDRVHDETDDAVQDETVDPVQDETVDPVHDETIDAVQDETVDPVQDETDDPVQDETVDPVQDETVDPVQDETVDPVQDETVDRVHDETDDAVQDETVDPVQDETVDPVHDETIDAVQDETVDPVQDETDDPVQDETVDSVQDETVDPYQDETVDPVQDETVDPLSRSKRLTKRPALEETECNRLAKRAKELSSEDESECDDNVQDEMEDPVHDETDDPNQDETVDPVQDETVDPVSSPKCFTKRPALEEIECNRLARRAKEVDDDFGVDFDEDLDDSLNDPDFKMTNSDVQSSDEFDDNDQAQGIDNEYVSDSSDQSDVIPCVISLPALQIKKVTSSKSQCLAHQVKNATTSRSQQHPPSSIVIQGTNNSKDKRVWDKIHFCFYCKSKFTNITKHYLGPHKHEPEVKMILDHPKKSTERSLALLKLRNAGDFHHNMVVLKNGTGTLITWARPDKENATYKDYLPCEDCRAFFLRSNLWRHRQTCPFIITKAKKQKVQSQAKLLLPTSGEVSSGLKENVISKMACDEVSIAVRNDSIIVAVGEKLFCRHGHLPHLNTYVSQKMRELGRFLIKVREIDLEIISMKCVMAPEKYPVAVKATRLLCKYNEDINKYSIPSLAIKLGHLLKKCAKIQKSSSLIECDSEKGKKADEFLSLVEAEWTDDISCSALQTLTSEKMNKGDVLPISEDILKLQAYFNDKTKNISDQLETTFSKTGWDELNQITLARVVLFNRRRGGETERVTLEAYDKRLSKSNMLREVEMSLSPVEKMLCSTFERIEIRGKKGRTVPVLLTPDILKCIDLLLKWRKEANVDQNNPFLFPRPNNSLQALRTTDVLRKFARLANLKYPNNLTSTKLRKHVATVSQILNLSKNDLEVMANFMGHDIEIHRSFYRIPQETLQVARMGKLLSAFDRGTISKYSGKSLDDISLNEELSSEDESECDDDVQDEMEDPVQDETVAPVQDETVDPVQDETVDPVSRSRRFTKRPALEETECNRLTKRAKDSCSGTSSSGNPTSRKSSSCPKQARKIQHLTEEQSRCLKSLFQANVTMRRELRMIDCKNAIQKYKCLSSLKWTKLKNTVHNWITTEKRKIKHRAKLNLS